MFAQGILLNSLPTALALQHTGWQHQTVAGKFMANRTNAEILDCILWRALQQNHVLIAIMLVMARIIEAPVSRPVPGGMIVYAAATGKIFPRSRSGCTRLEQFSASRHTANLHGRQKFFELATQ